MNRIDPRAVFDRMQGTAATALGLLLVTLLFVYFVPRQGEIASVMDARWERARVDAQSRSEAQARMARNAEAAGQAGAAGESGVASDPPAASPPVEPTGPVASDPSPPSPPSPAPHAGGSTNTMRLLARPVAVDTATIMIRRGKIRLADVQPVPMARKCGAGVDAWFCGVDARTRFRSWLLARSISCGVPEGFGERVETLEARCTLGGEDVGRWLVRNGWAEAVPGGTYDEDERQARNAKLGVWGDRRLGG